jgi:hypothetical protein
MKKVSCFVALLAMAATVFAGDVTVTCTSPDPSAAAPQVVIGYTGATSSPVGIAMVVDITNGTLDAAPTSFGADSFFDVFIDFAADDPATYAAGADPLTGVLSGAHPVAKTDAAGTPTFPVSVFSLCMGELANVATVPAAATLVTLNVTRTDSGQDTIVSVSSDPLRGDVAASSIVDDAAAYMTVTWPADLVLPGGGAGCACLGDLTDVFETPPGDGTVEFGDLNYMIFMLATNGWSIDVSAMPDMICGDIADVFESPGPDGTVEFGDLNYLIFQLATNGWSMGCL